MAGSAPQNEWYIARDGTQHGPLSDTEMRKFIELGHLRVSDLVWCAGFADWRPAPEVFPELAGHVPARPVIDSGPVAGPDVAAAGGGRQPASQPASQPALDRDRAQPTGAYPANRAAGGQRADAEVEVRYTGAPSASGPADSSRTIVPGSGGYVQQGQPGSYAAGYPEGQTSGQMRDPGGAVDWDAHSAGGGRERVGADFDDDDGHEAPRRSRFGKVAAIVAGLLIVGGAAWVGWQNFSKLPDVSSLGSAVIANVSREESPARAFHQSPFVAQGSTRAEIDASLQKSATWQALKRDFNSWYTERLADVERMRQQNEDEKVISKFLADVIVVLRRKNAQAALQASPVLLREMARAFLANLKQLASRDAQTCFGFISYGEASAFMLELSKTPAFAESLQKQLDAIFKAVAEGRKSPQVYQAAQRTDYDALTAELVKRGWTQDDLAVFSNPRRLSRSPPEKVCQMVQDWFAAQLGMTDQDRQGRLLAESLKPLVFG